MNVAETQCCWKGPLLRRRGDRTGCCSVGERWTENDLAMEGLGSKYWEGVFAEDWILGSNSFGAKASL